VKIDQAMPEILQKQHNEQAYNVTLQQQKVEDESTDPKPME